MSERPIECSHCKKQVHTTYQEIVDDVITCSEMCADCPILGQKLHGQPTPSCEKNKNTSLCCANCMTTLESVLTGNPLGCTHCYTVFEKVLMDDLLSQDKLPSRFQKEISVKSSLPLHLGKSPQTAVTLSPATRLTSLNEALNDALKKENYEQAAWLRDQIKELMGESIERRPTST